MNKISKNYEYIETGKEINNFQVILSENKLYIEMIIKRFFDILFALIGCFLLIPLTIIVKLMFVLCNDYHSIFVQNRIGKDGKTFKIYKYRTMVVNAESILDEMISNNEKIKNEYIHNKKLECDPRITKVGNFLRKSSIDEFPQFINVLIGNMSLIGPRPYLVVEKKDMGKSYEEIIQCKPGISGMWQVSGRSNLSFEKRLELDEYYNLNKGFKLDFIIFVKTIKTVISREGAK